MGIRQTILILGFAAASFAQDISVKTDEFVTAFTNQKKFSGSVLIAKEGKVIFEKAYGMANYEWSVPNTTDTKFRLGSITKQFAAAAILQLEEQGKLRTTDKACDYLPDCPESWKPITIHHLLTHTSGIPNFTALKEYQRLKLLPSKFEEQYKATRNLNMDFDPGTKHQYSNTGYIILGQIIEKASGKPWEVFLEEQIFKPAGMTNTRADSNRALILNRASGYSISSGTPVNAGYIDMQIPSVAGAMISTAGDLYKWDRALASASILSEASLQKMWTPDKENYAYGWVVQNQNGKISQAHGGGIDGFSTHIQRFPADNTLIVVLSNFDDAQLGELRTGLAAIAYGGSPELPRLRPQIMLDSATMDQYTGVYQLSPTFALTVTREGEQLFIQGTGQGRSPVYAETKDVVYPKQIPATVLFQRENGKVTGLILKQGGREIKGTKN